MPDPFDVFSEKITAIKRETRERHEQHFRPKRPTAITDITYDVDWGCWRWSGSDTIRKPGTMMPFTDLHCAQLRLVEAEYQRDLIIDACSQRNAVIAELENLLYTTLSHVPQYTDMKRKLQAIQTILDNRLSESLANKDEDWEHESLGDA